MHQNAVSGECKQYYHLLGYEIRLLDFPWCFKIFKKGEQRNQERVNDRYFKMSQSLIPFILEEMSSCY